MIKIDMEMPAKCSECRMQTDYGYCSAMPKNFCGNTEDDGKPVWCPLQDVPDTNAGKWISVKDGMPPEKETIFAKFKGTDKWNPAMFTTNSEDVRVVVKFEDGTRKVWHDNTMDGKWKCERDNVYPKRTVIYWMPNPELPKEEKQE